MSTSAGKTVIPREMMMGNEAIARGALEAGVQFVTGYPGTPSSEIVETVARSARETGVYVEWSINEKVAVTSTWSAISSMISRAAGLE